MSETKDLQYFILNYEKPVIFKGMLNWKMLSWNLQDWNNVLKNEFVKYRIGKQSYTKTPQWDNKTENKQSTFEDFIDFINKNPDKWAYCDYKHLIENFKNIEKIQNDISWKLFGFPEHTAEKSTIWIGSKAAHTPCHKDTYGCNLVAQIYGRKRWLLFPPEENLHPTRIPYEESSIFSKLNFFSPDFNKFKGLGRCKMVILQPGDVLLVPHGWWHYVENLEFAISVNVWLEKPEIDDKSRLDEAIVQFLIGRFFNDMNESERNLIINPFNDMVSFMEQINFNKSLKILDICKENYLKRIKYKKEGHQSSSEDHQSSSEEHQSSSEGFNCSEVLKKYQKNIIEVSDLTRNEFKKFLNEQSRRFTQNINNLEIDVEEEEDTLCKIINGITSESVIKLIKDSLIKIDTYK